MSDNETLHLIAGLGNIGDKYRRNRHNMGFMVVEELARRHGLTFGQRQARALVARGKIKGVPVVLALPQTFMNDSGEAVSGLARWYKLPLERIMVVYDELDLPLGTIRMRERGSTAGHNGMKSINTYLRSEAFPRLRVGIDKPPNGDTIAWVLGNFGKDEQREADAAIAQAADAVEAWLTTGIERAMNSFNTTAKAEPGGKKRERPTTPPPSDDSPAHPTGAEPRVPWPKPELPGLGGEIRQLRSRLFGHDGHK